MTTVKVGWKTYTKPANASSWRLAAARKSDWGSGSSGTSVTSQTGATNNPTNPTNQNIPTPPAPTSSSPKIEKTGSSNFSIPNFTDIYGDASKKATQTQQKVGLGTSFGGQITDLNKIDTSKIDLGTFKYGADVKSAEELAGRNDLIAAYAAKNNATDDVAIAKLLMQNQSFANASDADKMNTVAAIKKRIGEFWTTPAVETDPISREWATIESDYAQKKDALLKQGAVASRYTNFNEVDKEVQNVLKTAGEDRVAKNYQMPSDADIQAIAAKSGVTYERAKQIMQWFWYDTLQMDEAFKKETELGYTRTTDDLTTKLKREQEDLDFQLKQTKMNIDNQIQDVYKQAERNMEAVTIMGAIRWQSMTSGFMLGINRMTEDTNTTISRLQQQLEAAESLTWEQKARALEDYHNNLSRAKEDLDLQTRAINQQMGTAYSSIMQQYGGTNLANKLKELNSQMLDAKIATVNNYVDVINKINKEKRDEMDQLMDYDKYQRDVQKDTWTTMTANDGAVLQNYSVNDLTKMYQNGEISLSQLSMAQSALVTKAQNTLKETGSATAQDMSNLEYLMSKWYTAQEAVLAVVENSGGRLNVVQAKSQGSWVKTEDENGNEIFYNPTTNQTRSPNQMSQVDLGEEPVDTGIKNVYGSNVKLAPTVADMVKNAQSKLKSQGIDLKIADSYRSTAEQAAAYGTGKAWVAEPGKSFHEKWQAFDLSQKKEDWMNNEKVFQALKDAGLQQLPWERWHWSYGEMGTGKNKVQKLIDDVNNGYMTTTDVRKVLKDTKTSDESFLNDYLSSRAKEGDIDSIVDAAEVAMDALGVWMSWTKDEKAADYSKFFEKKLVPTIVKKYGISKAADYVIKTWWTDDKNLIADDLSIVYKGKKSIDEAELYKILDENWFNYFQRWPIVNKLKEKLWIE